MKTLNLNKKEVEILVDFLDEYSDRLACDGCNDWKFPLSWSREEKDKFVKEFYDWNDEPEYYEDGMDWLDNGCVVDLLRAKLRGKVK